MNKLIKYFLLSLGLIFMGIGLIGVLVPGLPTTIFMILAAYCFLRSSERLYNWVTSNKVFGARVNHFLETRTIPLKGKIHCLVAMWIMAGISIFILSADVWIKGIILLFIIIGTIVVLSFPTAQNTNKDK
ncbi:MAG: DUF454 domain-containing protein [Ignavibacteria bacterium]|nr:DUF454 domain-containing protein [Ignavibacteria bacterium]